ncbi:MAG: hypothetical protein OEM48_01315 [Gammaproteobacteria bacterium]|nr:hypothetical protein [Gammaproteobacteria bacterium]MDH3371090.1 hypothetical protein [Gammaproteobacteria bacterium]MDH3405555.1 hypothetical protein [Gammaproteobacteria bacterium]MDH5485998.1 hypothetical protein [Gammaproteobacteria bacterium]
MNRGAGYPGIHADLFGGMTDLGHIIRDAWVFGLLPETETCAGWSAPQFDKLYEKVHAAWEPYGHLASQLPPELRTRHERIYNEAVQRARAQGWSPDMDVEEG